MKGLKKQIVTEIVSSDFGLFDDLDSVIAILSQFKKEHPDKKLFLTDVWDGYEDVHYEIQYERLETDEEFEARKEELRQKKAREAAEAEKAIRRKEKEEQYQKLKRELGYW